MGGCRPQKGVISVRQQQQQQQQQRIEGVLKATEVKTEKSRGSINLPKSMVAFTSACRKARIGKWHPHEFRHTAASLMLANGIPLKGMSDILDHASIRITSDVSTGMVTPWTQPTCGRLVVA